MATPERTADSTPIDSPRRPTRAGATVSIFTVDPTRPVAEGITEVALSYSARGVFSVTTKKAVPNPQKPGQYRKTREKVGILNNPSDVFRILDVMRGTLGIGFKWDEVLPKVAQLDWVTAAVIASQQGFDLPELPTIESLGRQRSLKGEVCLGVEWGYEFHELNLSLDQWVRILLGEHYKEADPYFYEGEEYTALWSFAADRQDQLRVTYDDGGEGWSGLFIEIESLQGPKVDGVDLGRLTLDAFK
jgi:hypothetical protein